MTVSEEKGRVLEGGDETSKSGVKCSEVMWSEGK